MTLTIRLSLTCVFTLFLISFSTDGFTQTIIENGDVSGVWSKTGSPYVIKGNIVIPQNQKLVIEPGVKINFQGSYSLQVNGAIYAVGSESDSILFTVLDATGFPTNSHTGWKGIRFLNAQHVDSSYLKFVVLEYGKVEDFGDTDKGGVIFISSYSKLNLSHSTLRKNKAVFGGAVALVGSNNLRFNNLEIVNNYSSEYGGAIYSENSGFELINSRLINNKTNNIGGGLYIKETSLAIKRSQILGNSGVALKAHGLNTVFIENSTIAGNKNAAYSLDFYFSDLHCKNSILWNETNNSSFDEIFAVDHSNVKLDHCIVRGEFSPEWQVSNSTSQNPNFVDLGKLNVNLKWPNYPVRNGLQSPAIDAGDPKSPHDPDGTIADIGAMPYNQTSAAYPKASFEADTTLGVNPFTVNFNNYTTQAQGIISTWFWDFGDGTTSDQKSPTHIYQNSGVFDVKLVATNATAKVDSLKKSNYITVIEGTIVNSEFVFGTWTKQNSPYNIYNDITIPSTKTLVIEPGVEVVFFGRYQVKVKGSLKARGVKNDTIVFKQFNENTFWHSIRIEDVSAENDSTILEYCKIENTRYISGGVNTEGGNALFAKNSDKVRISNCSLQNNYGGRGAGIYCDHSNIKITNNRIRNNGTDQYGAGLYVFYCSPSIMANSIENNYANNEAGGVYFENSASVFTNNIVEGNGSHWNGAGIVMVRSNVHMERNIISFNVSDFNGGGLVIDSSNPTSINNTISFNAAREGAGIYVTGSSNPDFINTIIYSNLERNQSDVGPDEIYLATDDADPNFYNCDIYGGISGITVPNGTKYTGIADHNIDAAPLFANPSNKDFSLTWQSYPVFGKTKSRCIDAGKLESPHDPDGSIADIGAHYFPQDDKKFEPRSDFTADTLYGFNQLDVQFSDLSDPGSGPITEWHWDFGDGNVSSLQNPLHTYLSVGQYDVTLVVKDANGFEKMHAQKKYIQIYQGTYIKGSIEGVLARGKYLVGGNLLVENGKSVKVEAGAEFVFLGTHKFEVYGSLQAIGEANTPIIFTSHNADQIRFGDSDYPQISQGWGGLYVYVSGPADSTIIDHCKIEFVERSNQGGAIYAFSNEAGMRISNNEISYNTTPGIVAVSSKLIIKNNYIHHNSSGYSSGAGIHCTSAPKIVGNIICSNKANNDGGGIYIDNGSPSIINNVICHNTGLRGGGICDYEGWNNFINNTICYNTSASGAGGGYYGFFYGGEVKFMNTIIAKNFPDQVHLSDWFSRVGFVNCILQNGKEAIYWHPEVFLYENVLTSDPMIAAAIAHHGRLLENSPAIDAGTLVDVEPLLPKNDLLGNVRINNSKVDIGAYEYSAIEPVVLKTPIVDYLKDEDFIPFSIPLDSSFTYAGGSEFVNFTIANSSDINVVHATVKNRQLYITPIADHFGEQQIVLRASDGITDSINDSFIVRVNAINDPPKFTIQGDVLLDEDFGRPLKYEIVRQITFGEENEPNLYSLVPQSVDFVATSLTQSGALTFSPKENSFGVQEFTLSLSDGQSIHNESFHLAIESVNDAPVISTVSQTKILVGEKMVIPVVVSDIENDPISFTAYSAPAALKTNVVRKSENEYTLEIEGIKKGTSYIYISASDQDTISYANIDIVIDLITSTENSVNLPFRVYPNPTEKFVMLDGEDLKGSALFVYSSTGELVVKRQLDNSENFLDIGQLPAGVYFLKLVIRNNSYTYKVMKR